MAACDGRESPTNGFLFFPTAISRIDRIGQNRKTHVWRYLMEDTIEVKIDALRMEHQEDEVDDAIYEGRKLAIQAGGIDGGLHSAEELFDLLS